MSTADTNESGTESGAERTVARNSFPVDVWVTLERWVRKMLRNPFVVFEALLTPLIFLVLFTEVFGQITGDALSGALGTEISYVTYLVPAIVILTAMEAAANSGIGLVNDMDSGMFEKVLVSPTHRGAIFLGKVLSDVVRVVVQTGLILVLGYAVLWVDSGGSVDTYVETGPVGILGIFAIAILFALWFAAFSNVAALVTRDHESTVILATLLQYPMLFLSSAFLPVGVLPGWMQVVATYNPVTYGVDAVRALMFGQDVLTAIDVTAFAGIWNTIVPAVVVLVALDLLLGGVAVVLLRRVSDSRASYCSLPAFLGD